MPPPSPPFTTHPTAPIKRRPSHSGAELAGGGTGAPASGGDPLSSYPLERLSTSTHGGTSHGSSPTHCNASLSSGQQQRGVRDPRAAFWGAAGGGGGRASGGEEEGEEGREGEELGQLLGEWLRRRPVCTHCQPTTSARRSSVRHAACRAAARLGGEPPCVCALTSLTFPCCYLCSGRQCKHAAAALALLAFPLRLPRHLQGCTPSPLPPLPPPPWRTSPSPPRCGPSTCWPQSVSGG
jgi:hypothetical protein